jgi:hypothetical protein
MGLSLRHKERMEILRAADIKVRSFAYKLMPKQPNSCKAPKVFDTVPSLIRDRLAHTQLDEELRLADSRGALLPPHNRPSHHHGDTPTKVSRRFIPVDFAMLREYSDLPDEHR